MLPNGDVLVAESNGPAGKSGVRGLKGKVMGAVMKRAGAGEPSADRITLLRDTDGDGVAEQSHVFASGLHSPFGMALVGDRLYIANADAVVDVRWEAGMTTVAEAPRRLAGLPGGPRNHHWTKSLLAGADGGIGSTYNIMGWRYQAIAKAVREGDNATAQRLQSECNTVIDLLIKAGVFRGLKTVLHYMDVVSVPLCRKPFAPVDEKYLPELKALADQLLAEKA